MPIYTWEGTTRTGEKRSGKMEAASDNEVMQSLRQQNINVLKVKAARELKLSFGSGVTMRDLVIFTRQFSTMIDAGLPLVQAMDILASQADNKRFGKILFDVKRRVEGGATLSDSMRAHPKVFDDLYTNMVAAGEAAGILDAVLQRLATQIEKTMKLTGKVKGAMVYPAGVFIVAVLVIGVMLGKVIPVFETMFKDMGAGALPALTQLMINISRGFVSNWYLILGSMIAFAVAFTTALRTYKGRYLWHKFLLKLPVLGVVIRKSAVARFTRTFGTLLSSGVAILDAMEIVAKTAGNLVIEEGIRFVRERVAEGKDVATPLMQTGIFPPMVVQMIGVGEQTGAMDAMLQKIADFYEEEVDVAVAAMTSLLEPIMIVFLGGIVGTLMIAMYMPIFELGGAIKGQ